MWGKKRLIYIAIILFCLMRLVCNLKNPHLIWTISGDYDTSSRNSHIRRPLPSKCDEAKTRQVKLRSMLQIWMSVNIVICNSIHVFLLIFFVAINHDLDISWSKSKIPVVLVPVLQLSSPDLILVACSWQRAGK